MIAIIRLRGPVDMIQENKDTFDILNLGKKNNCVIIQKNPVNLGMIKRIKDWATWGEISDDMLIKLIKKRGRKTGDSKLTDEEVDAVFKMLKAGKKMNETGITPVFRLTPPSKGFKNSVKQQYPRGELGYRKEHINELLKRMI